MSRGAAYIGCALFAWLLLLPLSCGQSEREHSIDALAEYYVERSATPVAADTAVVATLDSLTLDSLVRDWTPDDWNAFWERVAYYRQERQRHSEVIKQRAAPPSDGTR